MKATLIDDDIDLIIAIVEDASEKILQRYREKKETLYECIEKELKEIQEAIHSSHAIPTANSSSNITELRVGLTQL